MKRQGYLITEQNVTHDFCVRMIRKASKGKAHRPEVMKALVHIDEYAERLREMAFRATFKASPYDTVVRTDASSGKRRLLDIPQFYPDQCMHHLVIALGIPRIMRGMDPWSCGCIKGRGPTKGHKAICKWMRNDRRGTKYAGQCDVRKCYPTTPHKLIKDALRRKFKDARYLRLCDEIIDSFTTSFPEFVDMLSELDSGLPLGNYTSSWWLNLAFEDLDRYIRTLDGVEHDLRYVDDMLIFGRNKKKLHRAVAAIQNYCQDKLGVKIKRTWQVYKCLPNRPVDMLGYKHYHGYSALRGRNALMAMRVAREVRRRIERHQKITPHLAGEFLSRIGAFKHCNSRKFMRKYVWPIPMNIVKGVIRNESRTRHDAQCLRDHPRSAHQPCACPAV